jgi:O-antigen ligase
VASAARSAIAPLYLLACLILGGSAQGSWQNMVLQLAGLAILAWAAAAPAQAPLPPSAKPLLILVLAGVAVAALQLVPLPAGLWAHGSRAPIADGFRLLGLAVPSEPLSLTPYASLGALLCLIPPLAMFCAMVRLNAYRPSWLAAALLAGTLCGVLLGAVQVNSRAPDSPWYLYPDTNFGSAVGFFANANHMASLLVIALPFVAATAAAGKSRNLQRYSALLSILAGVTVVLVVGIALNGSLAGYALAVPVLAASALVVLAPANRLRHWVAVFAALSVIAAVAVLATSAIGSSKIGQDATTSVQSREEILATTARAITDHMPFGSGLGSFVKVYRLYERPDTVTSEYVVHAHNDYAELALELGLPSIILMLLFLAWWIAAAWRVWRTGEGGPFALAASIASAAILVHSLVDFPLRTAAISSCFAMCLALLADRRVAQREDSTDLRPTRHIVVK